MMPNTARLLTTNTAYLLDEARIKYVAIGWQALDTIGEEKPPGEVDMAILDGQIADAIKHLVTAGFDQPCNRPNCAELKIDRGDPVIKERELARARELRPELGSKPVLDPESGYAGHCWAYARWHGIAEAHFHINGADYLLSLHRKSQTLWWMSDEEFGITKEDLAIANAPGSENPHPHLILSTDAERIPPRGEPYNGSGPWGTLYAVKILNPDSFTDAVLFLLCRYLNHEEHLDKMCLNMIACLKDKSPNRLKKNVRPEFKHLWDAFNGRANSKVLPLVAAKYARSYLAGRNELGPLPLPPVREEGLD